jgi:adenylate kinase family enzyme
MTPCRLHIFGASGTGTSTLGRAMADAWSVPFHDTDDYFWLPTEPPYTTHRPVPERLVLMQDMFLPRRAWVLAGSLAGWGDPLIPCFDAVVFLKLDPTTRMARLRAREVTRYGAEEVAPGGRYHDGYQSFMTWAAGYDDPDFNGRSLARHQDWLDRIKARTLLQVVELDAAMPTDRQVTELLAR